jgi:eukaryotic-like serine/threonine-protein kinase
MSDPAPERPAGAPGELSGRVGKYEIRHQLGRGAMGVVYRAYDTVLEREVALKVMAAHMADDPGVYERFAREAKAVARMTHPNVVTVFDLGSHDNGSPFIAMELLKGQDLAKAIRTPPALPLEEKLAVVLQVLAGLAHAHQAGIVHRDIKPANVFLSHDGTVKLMDFGIARLTAASMTGTGTVVGTADYMSPEQVQAARVDGRSDLFSVGCVLYELLTGQRPFHADDLIAIFYRITTKEPDWTKVTDAPLLPVVRKALAKDLAQRYQSAEEFAVALKAAMDKMALRPAMTATAWPSAPTQVGRAGATLPGAIDATHVLRTGSRTRPLLYGAAAVLVLAGAAALFLRGPAAQPVAPSPATQAAVLPARPPASEPAVAVLPTAPPSVAPAVAASAAPQPAATTPPRLQPPAVRPTPDARASAAEREAAEAARQTAAQLSAFLGQAESDLAAQKYDASIQGFDRALGLDPQNARALQGKSAAIAARAIAQASAVRSPAAGLPPIGGRAEPTHAFVSERTTTHAAEGGAPETPEGFSDSPGVAVKRGSQAAALPGRILFEVEPRSISGSMPYKVRIYLLNEGTAAIQVKDMVVSTSVNGRASRAPVPPLAREVAPGQQALLREVAGQWKIDTTAWSMEVLVRTQRGEAYQNRVTWQ